MADRGTDKEPTKSGEIASAGKPEPQMFTTAPDLTITDIDTDDTNPALNNEITIPAVCTIVYTTEYEPTT